MRYPLASKKFLTWAVVLGLQAILRFSEGVCETAEFYTGALNSRSSIASVSVKYWPIVCLGIGVVGLYRSLFILE